MSTSSDMRKPPPHLNPLPQGGEEENARAALRVRGPNRSPEARDFARELRHSSTDAEKRLWRLLRGRHFQGFKFRREYPCGVYFLDFYCVEARLAVELDGGGHGFPEQRSKDIKRDEFLASQGIKVLRFWNHQVRRQIESVRFEIWFALMERTGQTDKIAHYLPKRKKSESSP